MAGNVARWVRTRRWRGAPPSPEPAPRDVDLGAPVPVVITPPDGPGIIAFVMPFPHQHDARLPHCARHQVFAATCRPCVDIVEQAAADGTLPDLGGTP
jgi:hypothetical protein